jgi:hypothetical protein
VEGGTGAFQPDREPGKPSSDSYHLSAPKPPARIELRVWVIEPAVLSAGSRSIIWREDEKGRGNCESVVESSEQATVRVNELWG